MSDHEPYPRDPSGPHDPSAAPNPAEPAGPIYPPPPPSGYFGPPASPVSDPYASYGYVPTHATAGLPQDDPAPATTAATTTGAGLRRTVVLVAVLAALIGGGVGAGVVAMTRGNSHTTVNAGLAFSSQTAPALKVDGSVSAAAARIRPSVVTIEVTGAQQSDTGSGVAIRADGYVLTNNHVIANATGAAGSIVVTLGDGTRVDATVVGTDQSDDLAVLKVANTTLTAATFASSASLIVGQTVVAVGAPLGLSDTVTSGIISSTARPVTTGDSQSSLAVFDAVQTDAAINPGNSGGPLVNLNGDVVGINAAIATDQSSGGLQIPGQTSQAGNIGIGFAIPSDEASRIAAQLIATGKATHAVLGVSVESTPNTAPTASPVGAVVHAVTAGSPAAAAGLQIGDVVIEAGGQRIDSSDALVAEIRSNAPGQTVSITYLRTTTSHTVSVKLGESAQ